MFRLSLRLTACLTVGVPLIFHFRISCRVVVKIFLIKSFVPADSSLRRYLSLNLKQKRDKLMVDRSGICWKFVFIFCSPPTKFINSKHILQRFMSFNKLGMKSFRSHSAFGLVIAQFKFKVEEINSTECEEEIFAS